MNRDSNVKNQLNEINRLCTCILSNLKNNAQTQTYIKKTLTNGLNADSKGVNFNEESWETKPDNYAEALDHINEQIKDVSKLNDFDNVLKNVLNIEDGNANFNEESWGIKPDNYAEALDYISEQIQQISTQDKSGDIMEKLTEIQTILESLEDKIGINSEDTTINYECPSELREFFEYFHSNNVDNDFTDMKFKGTDVSTILKNIEPLFIYKFDNEDHRIVFDMFRTKIASEESNPEPELSHNESNTESNTESELPYEVTIDGQTYEFKIINYIDHSIITTSNNLNLIKPNNIPTTSKHPIITLKHNDYIYYIITTYNEIVFNSMVYNKYRTRPNNSFISIPFIQFTKTTPEIIQDANTLQSFINANSDLYEHMHVWAKSGCIPGMYFANNYKFFTYDDEIVNDNIIKKIFTPLREGYIYAQVKFMLPKTNKFISTNELKMNEYSIFEKLKYPIDFSNMTSNDDIKNYKKYGTDNSEKCYLYDISETPADHWPEICQVYYCDYIPEKFPN